MAKQLTQPTIHWGRQVEKIRHLLGMTQTDLGKALGISKQAVSKMEKTETMRAKRISSLASIFGLTEERLKTFDHGLALAARHVDPLDTKPGLHQIEGFSADMLKQWPLEKTIALFEKLIKKEKEYFERIIPNRS
jgi:transcriptional regulator with XRE-family HTH domain